MIRYYFSGTGIHRREFESVYRIHYRLLSMYKDYITAANQWGDACKADPRCKDCTLLLDSGAFSAWSKGAEVGLNDLIRTYDKYLNTYRHSVKEIFLINLDKIPGSPGRTAEAAEIALCEEESDKNFTILRKHFGDCVLPVFHQNESRKRLDDICEMSHYVCISPRNDLPEPERVRWSAQIHNITTCKGNITHGLAATGKRMLATVPWYSVDSATWLMIGSNGGASILLGNSFVNIGFSPVSPTRFDENMHYQSAFPAIKEQIDARLALYGYTADDMAVDHECRFIVTALELQEWAENVVVCRPSASLALFEEL